MPKGVSKATFNKFKKCYNSTAFVAAGKRYRQLAREADSMHVEERMQRISEIFSYFHNPDKETVLTPWRVVNMHLSETLGGYTFFNEQFSGPNEKIIINTESSLFEFIPTNEPRFVKRGEVTSDIFSNSDAKILEINSKTGLYPLYVTYSLYRRRLKEYIEKIGKERFLAERLDVGIISPYKVQMQYLRQQVRKREEFRPFRHAISVNTVDGFQGQERDIVMISLVRSNDKGEIGFLSDLRRMNVAMTRARMKLIIFGDKETLHHHAFYKKLIQYVEELNS
jgi:hypothetical protein